jgi:hypothetical protein
MASAILYNHCLKNLTVYMQSSLNPDHKRIRMAKSEYNQQDRERWGHHQTTAITDRWLFRGLCHFLMRVIRITLRYTSLYDPDFPKTVGPDRQKCSRTDDFKIYRTECPVKHRYLKEPAIEIYSLPVSTANGIKFSFQFFLKCQTETWNLFIYSVRPTRSSL